MRIHSDLLTTSAFYSAAREAGVSIIELRQQGSKSRERSFDVYLSGSHYAMTQFDFESPAATWDEWGNFLAHLFKLDPKMVAGWYQPRLVQSTPDQISSLGVFLQWTQDEMDRFTTYHAARTKNPALIKTAPWLRDQSLRALA